MDWFERLTGFREVSYADTRAKLEVEGRRLRSIVNGQSWEIGELEVVSLAALRQRATASPSGRPKVRIVQGDVRKMHAAPEYAGALFQVASQFNALEMTSPDVTPEDGVTRYQYDRTQGPACAIAAGAATLYRNFFAPVGGGIGQTADRQIDGLAAVGEALSRLTSRPVAELWRMRNGYALCGPEGLEAISAALGKLGQAETDALRENLAITVHSGVEVTDPQAPPRSIVSQAFGSALPVAYTNVPARHWRAFATLVLEAVYEATLWAGIENARLAGSKIVALTMLGGGVFGNDEAWIFAAIRRALQVVAARDLDVRVVSYGAPSSDLVAFVESLNG